MQNGKLLGKGSFGAVYKSEYKNQPVAVKRYNRNGKKDFNYQILREINIIKMVNHINVVKFIDINTINHIEIIMEYGGINLRYFYNHTSLLRRLELLQKISHQILSGLHYLHSLNIIHRDIKPDNILINESTHIVKICDLGLARKTTPMNQENNSYQVGTLHYRAPELYITDTTNYTFNVDIWSLGCVLYEFVLARKIFPGKSETMVLKQILNQIPIKRDELQLLGLDHIDIKFCNQDKFYKLPSLYQFGETDIHMIQKLDLYQNLLQKMLCFYPNNRASTTTLLQHSYFTGLNFPSPAVNNSVFYVRRPLSITTDIRDNYVKNLCNKNSPVNLQTLLLTIELFDKYLSFVYDENNCDFDLVLNACLLISSKYIDIKPLSIKYFTHANDKMINMERAILNLINYNLDYITLVNIYENLLQQNLILQQTQDVAVILQIICDYNLLCNSNMQQITELLLNKLKT